MAASATDYFTEVGNPGTATTLAAPGHSIAGTAFTVVSTSNWPTNTGVIFAIDQYSTVTGARVAGTYTEWEGVVASSTSITGGVLRYGTDQNYSAGATTRVYIPVASSRENRLVQGLAAIGVNQDATITPLVKTAIKDTNGNEVLRTPATTSAVNDVTITNSATTVAPSIAASGDDAAVNLNLRGKGLAKTVTIGAGATTIYPYDYVASGCVWTADAAGSTRLASMTAGVVVINGNPVSVAAVTSRTFTASKDVYVDILDNGDGTGLPVYFDNTTNAASPALASNSVRLGIVVVGASNIAAAASINQGQETAVLPIASSTPYAVTDSLGNLICPRDPHRKILGYRQIVADFVLSASQGTATQVTGLSVPFIVPAGRKVKVTFRSAAVTAGTSGDVIVTAIWDGTVGSGTELTEAFPTAATQAINNSFVVTTPATTSKTYNASIKNATAARNVTVNALTNYPAILIVELT